NVPHLAIRSEMRSLQALKGRLDTQRLTVDRGVLRALALNRLNQVIIPVLEDDVIFHKIFQKIRKKTATWIGKDETGKTRIILTLGDDHFFAKVVADDKTILFNPAEGDNQVVSYLVDQSLEVPLIDDDVTPSFESQDPIPAALSADDGSRIDVMVLYTDGMASAHPGSQIETRIQNLIDQANAVFSNSNIDTRFNLVHSEEVNYPDDSLNGMDEALDDLTDNIGVFDDVENLRTEYGADQVTLLRRFVDEGCGLAWLPRYDNADLAYAVVHDGSKTDGSGYYCSDLTYVHEVGHNLGCAHDRAHAGSSGRYPYSYGYQDPDENFRTVMSYNCPGGCNQIAYFSNPNVTYMGDPTGIADPNLNSADNARTINQTRVGMAGYRDEVQPSITVISPDGDEVWRKDTSHMIAWSSSNLTGNIKIELFQGGILDTTIDLDADDTGSFSWTVPQSLSLGTEYRIRISSTALPAIFDESDGEFTIAEALETKAMPWIPLLVLP
ncbi:MAG: M12 family metallo-peptidase, partial [Desulfobacterales bacterium]